MEVLEIEGEIKGVTSVCPIVEEVTYELKSSQELSKAEWSVEGGEIISQDNLKVTVRWGDTNPNARLIAVPYTMEGCPGNEFVLEIAINQIIESEIPEGELKICYDPDLTWVYSVPNVSSNRSYEWFVEGGEIVSGGDSGEVEIKWNKPVAFGQVWFKEYSLLDNLCEGESPRLDVELNGLFEVTISKIEDVLCFGGDSGKIELQVSGGEAPHSFSWDHSETISGTQAENLVAGTYGVTITDAFGCEIRLNDIRIEQPESLELISKSTSATSCFGRADGEAVIQLQGGVAPFRIDVPNAIITGHEIRLFDLEGISYLAIVKDANGCELPVDFVIDTPFPVNVDIRMQKPSCPGESNGGLIAEPTGGFAPYEFTWEYDNSNNNSLEDIPKGIYKVSILDNRGCVSLGAGEVIEEQPKVRMPTGFRPEEGPFEAVSNCGLTFQLLVYSRWGELLYNGEVGWDGTRSGEQVPSGSYTYFICYQYLLNGEPKEEENRGIFTLIR